jgi:hypothetical protein
MRDFLRFLLLLFWLKTSQPNSPRTMILLGLLRNEFHDLNCLLQESAMLYGDILRTGRNLPTRLYEGGVIDGINYGLRNYTSLSFIPLGLRQFGPRFYDDNETARLLVSQRVRYACMLLSFSSSLLSKFLGKKTVNSSFMRPFLTASRQNSCEATILFRLMLKLNSPVLKFEGSYDSFPRYKCHALRPLVCSVPSPFGRDSWTSQENKRLTAHICDFLKANPNIEITWQELVRIVEWAFMCQNILQCQDAEMFDLDCMFVFTGWLILDPVRILMIANRGRLLDRGLRMYLQAKKEKIRNEIISSMKSLVEEIVEKAIASASSAVVPSD